MADFKDAKRIALTLPSTTVEESNTEGQQQFLVNDKSFAWTYMERIEGRRGRVTRPDVLAVRVADEWDKKALIASDPEIYFTDAHYNNYPAILVRLPAIEMEELTELLTSAWRIRAPRKMVAMLPPPAPPSQAIEGSLR